MYIQCVHLPKILLDTCDDNAMVYFTISISSLSDRGIGVTYSKSSTITPFRTISNYLFDHLFEPSLNSLRHALRIFEARFVNI